jgi:hypothetical protein
MRYTDLEYHCNRLTAMAFVPSQQDVDLAAMLHGHKPLTGIDGIILQAPEDGPVRKRIADMALPEQ